MIRREVRGAVSRLYHEHPDECVISGPRGTGKSVGIGLFARWVCETYPGTPILVVRETRESLTDSWMKTWEEDVMGPDDVMRTPSARENIHSYKHPNGSEIVLCGFNKPDRFLSTSWALIIANECTELTLAQWMKLLPLLRGNVPTPFRKLVGDCNPADEQHWVLRREQEGKLQHWRTWHWDNPAYYSADGKLLDAGRDYLDRKLTNLSGVDRERYLFGRWVSAEGVIWPGFDRSFHVVDAEPVNARGEPVINTYVGVIDWGFRCPGCFHIYGVDKDGVMYLVHEMYRAEMSQEEWADHCIEVRERWWYMQVVADPADPGKIEYFNRRGIPTVKADNRWESGRDAVAARLVKRADGKAGLYVVRGCNQSVDPALLADGKPTGFLEEIGQYVYRKAQDGRPIKEEPEPTCAQHGADCLRYGVAHCDRANLQSTDVPAYYPPGTIGHSAGHNEIFNPEPMLEEWEQEA